MSGCRVYVGNLPFTVREDQIRHRFEEIGSVKEVSVPKDEERGTNKGFAFVEYFEHDVAAAAVRHINGQELEGRTLKVDFAGENRDSRSRGDRGNLRTKGRGPTAPAPPAVLPAPVAKLPSQLPVGAEKVAQAAARMAAQLGVQGPLSSAAQRQTNAALARMTPQELFQVMTQLRGLTAADPERTKKVLQDNPQLAMALYQVEVLLGMATTNPSSEQDAVLQQPAAPAALPVPNGQLRYPAAAAGMLLPTAVASHVVATQPTEMAALGPGGVAVPLQQQQQPQPQPQAVAAPGPGAAMVPMVPQVVQGSAPPHMEQQQQQQQAAFHVQMIPQQPQPQPQQSMYAPTAVMQPPSQGLVVGGLPGAPGSLGMLAAPAAAQPAPGPAYPAAPLASGVPLGSAAPEAMQQAPPPAEALAAPAPGGSLMASGNYQEVLRKVLEMSQEQIDGLPPQHRDQVLALKQMHQGLQG